MLSVEGLELDVEEDMLYAIDKLFKKYLVFYIVLHEIALFNHFINLYE